MIKKIIYTTLLGVGLITCFSGCETPALAQLSATDLEIDEGSDSYILNFKVYLNQEATKELTFDFTTIEVNATEGEDFLATSGTVIIAKGETEAVIPITIIGDLDPEDTETFWLSYSNPINLAIPQPFNQITLINDDGAQPVDDAGYTTPNSYTGYTLAWSDEFDGTQLNTSDWNYETGGSGWGNQESQYYRSGTKNAEVAQGYLRITAKEETYLGAPFTSARLTTQGKQSFKYGRIDIRAKLPYGSGLWPALWMLGDNISSVGWPACGELDIMELIGGDGYNDQTVHGTGHWRNNGQQASYGSTSSLTSGKYADEFHVFSVVWNQNSIKWYRDNILFSTLNTSSISAFQEQFFFILNIAVEGDWPGPVSQATVFPQYMLVDYIRVFQ